MRGLDQLMLYTSITNYQLMCCINSSVVEIYTTKQAYRGFGLVHVKMNRSVTVKGVACCFVFSLPLMVALIVTKGCIAFPLYMGEY